MPSNERLIYKAIQDKLREQNANPTHFIWAVLRPVILHVVGTGPGDVDYFTVSLRLISGLFTPLTFIRLEAEVKLNDNPLRWIEFHSASRTLDYNTVWRGDEPCHLTGSQVREVSAPVAPSVSVDVAITLPDGRRLVIQNVREVEPHQGDIIHEDI